MNKILSPDPYGFKSLWSAVLEIYETYRGICAKYNLKHFALGGTAIGAVRHKGFIPWDDDFDVGMPRPDYEKFLQVVEKELPRHLKFVNWKNTKEFGMPFGKIQDSRRDVVEAIEKECGFMLSNGIFIDIFPIDGDYPAGSISASFKRLKLKLIAALERFHCHKLSEQSRIGKVGWLAGMMLAPFFPMIWRHEHCLRQYEKVLLRPAFDSSKNTFFSGAGLNQLISVSAPNVWGEATDVPFESARVSISSRYDDYLRAQFGDYMQLPPKSAQCPSHSYATRCPWWLGSTENLA